MADSRYLAPNYWPQNVVQCWEFNWSSSSQPVPIQVYYHSSMGNLTVKETYKRNQSQVVPMNNNTISHGNYQLPNIHHQTGDTRTAKHKSDDENSRLERFIGVPISSKSSSNGPFGSASPFFIQIKKYLNLESDGLPSKTPAMLPIVVEKAVQGIIEEGKQLGKERKAEKIASILRQKKDAGMKEIWKQCVYFYTSTNFLYKSVNSTMKSVVEKEEKIWRSNVPALGPFCLLLMDYPFQKEMTGNKTIYRGANMNAAQITQYEEMAKDKTLYQTFQVYTSCTRNRKKAKALGNTLFTMEVPNSFTMDLSPYSKYPEEEEELIIPGVRFQVKSVTFDQKKNRHLINLELQSLSFQPREQKVSTTTTNTKSPIKQSTPKPASIVRSSNTTSASMTTGLSAKVPIPVASTSTIAKKHIFLAYAEDDESDASMVEKLKNYFLQRRFRVYHPRKNEDINTQIANGIEKAVAVLVFPSPSFEMSKSGSKLLNYADQNKTPILSIVIHEDYQPMNWLGAILAPAKSCSTDFDEVIQSLISLGIKTSDLVLERGEKNEPQPIEEYLFQGGTESGNLKASYYQSGKQFPMKFKLLALKNGKVVGQGEDKDGVFTIAGDYKIDDRLGTIEMQKQHAGKQAVKYQGKISFQELNCMIEGRWNTGEASDKFFMHLTLPRPYTGSKETIPPPQVSRKQGTKVVISYCPCQFEFAQKLTKGLMAKGIPAVCPTMNVHEMIKTAAQKARVVVPLMSKAYEASNTAKYVLSYVDEAGIPIVPVKAQDPYTQSGWLGVICAGALWTQMTDAKEFEKKLDELIAQLQPYMTDCADEEEQDDVLVDEEFVEGYYMESEEEFPMEFDMFSLVNGYIAGEGEDPVGSFVISGEYYGSPDTEDIKFEFKKHYIENYDVHYSGIITEEESILSFDGKWSRNNSSDVFHLEASRFEPSQSERLHVMLSYQWDSQKLVKKIADKLKEKKIPIWFDIAGDMKGNINSAMAHGVQDATMIVSFDTLAYSKSINCKKELTYAKQLEKNIVPVLLEDEKGFQNTWLGNAINSLEKVNMKNESDFDSSFGVLLQRIEQALDQKVDDDSDESEVITRFEGGAVQGKYYEGDQSFDLKFDFFSLIEGKVSGQGGDDDEAFTMAGRYDNEGNIRFKEQYVEKHVIEYKGKLICDEFGGFKIEGIWNTNNGTGNFYLESVDDDDDASESN